MESCQEPEKRLEELNRRIISCKACPRLVQYRRYIEEHKPARYMGESYWSAPLPGFGDIYAEILVLGLAPAAHGGNRTGRMFTGDSSGNTLIRSLYEAGLANKPESVRAGDGLVLRGVYVTASVRCAPPNNKPSSEERRNCMKYLAEEFRILSNVKVVVALGRLAFDTFITLARDVGISPAEGRKPRFAHGGVYRFVGRFFGRDAPVLVASYHPSRQNTNTGRLTQQMLTNIFLKAQEIASGIT